MAAPMQPDMLEVLSNTNEEQTAIAQSLIDIKCCPRCVLRYMGEKRSFVYRAPMTELKTLVDKLYCDDKPAEDKTPVPCPACLGILEELCDPPFFDEVKCVVEKGGYEFRDYQCSLMLPVSLILREHSLLIYLKSKFSVYERVDGDSLATVKDVWKWYSGPELAQILNSEFQNRSAFDIIITITHDDSERECNFLLDVQPHIFQRRKSKKFETFNRANVAKGMGQISDKKFKECYNCPPTPPKSVCRYQLDCFHDAVFIAGRYNKYSRTLSQTPWLIDGVRKSESSVEELVCQVLLEKFKPTDQKFSSSGREDVDVRMLGTGRPFVVEFINPHVVNFTKTDMKDIQEKTNSLTKDIAISDLQLIAREDTAKLKEGEIEKTKSYSALCWCEADLSHEKLDTLKDIKDLKLDQKTPIRVLHRRPLATRERIIHNLHANKIDSHHFKLYMSTQAGTYIKEFVHGDFGRTTPNMSSLMGAECDILELDVEAVNVEWPPRLS